MSFVSGDEPSYTYPVLPQNFPRHRKRCVSPISHSQPKLRSNPCVLNRSLSSILSAQKGEAPLIHVGEEDYTSVQTYRLCTTVACVGHSGKSNLVSFLLDTSTTQLLQQNMCSLSSCVGHHSPLSKLVLGGERRVLSQGLRPSTDEFQGSIPLGEDCTS